MNLFNHPAPPGEPVKNQPNRKDGFDELLTPDLIADYRAGVIDPTDFIAPAQEAKKHAVDITGPETLEKIPKGVNLAYFLSSQTFKTMTKGQTESNLHIKPGTDEANHVLPLDFIHIGLGKLKNALSTGNLRFDEIRQPNGKTKLRLTLDNAAGTYRQTETTRYIYVLKKLFELNIVPDEIVFNRVENGKIVEAGTFEINP